MSEDPQPKKSKGKKKEKTKNRNADIESPEPQPRPTKAVPQTIDGDPSPKKRRGKSSTHDSCVGDDLLSETKKKQKKSKDTPDDGGKTLKKKKRKHDETTLAEVDVEPTKPISLDDTEKDSERNDEVDVGNKARVSEDVQDSKGSSSSSNRKKRQRVLEREALLEKVPKVDAETGIAYTKQQIRRMRKRVARGLDPVETEAEKQKRLALDAQLRREEEAELAGLIVTKPNKNGVMADDEEPMDEEDEEGEGEEVNDDDALADATGGATSTTKLVDDEDEGNVEDDVKEDDDPFAYEKSPQPASVTLAEKPLKPKKRRDKPVPDDYVCSACQNANGAPRHWIYDCPQKKTMPGTNQVSRKQRGLNNPADNKVFVSGLPFDATPADVVALFSGSDESAKAQKGGIVHCKLIKFEDTGRCKGQAFVTFDSADSAKRALKLNGAVIDNSAAASTDKKSKDDSKSTRKELKLKVTKVLNRLVTKAKK